MQSTNFLTKLFMFDQIFTWYEDLFRQLTLFHDDMYAISSNLKWSGNWIPSRNMWILCSTLRAYLAAINFRKLWIVTAALHRKYRLLPFACWTTVNMSEHNFKMVKVESSGTRKQIQTVFSSWNVVHKHINLSNKLYRLQTCNNIPSEIWAAGTWTFHIYHLYIICTIVSTISVMN